MIKVSVIMPVYNAEKYLDQALESILNQTLKDIEVICIDDSSDDRSRAILQNWAKKDKRMIVLEQEHAGGGAARNKGIEYASGQYLSFLDADDFFDEGMLESIYYRADTLGVDVLIYGVKCFHQATGAVTEEHSGLRKEILPPKDVFSWIDMPRYIFNAFHNWPWNKLFKRDFVIKNDLRFQEIHRTNDLLFVNKALILAKKITEFDEGLVYYRIQTSNNCQSRNDKYPLDFYKAFLELKHFLIKENVYEAVKQSYINHAADACIANLISLEFSREHRLLFDKLKMEIINELNIDVDASALFHSFNYSTMIMLQQILNSEYEVFLAERLSWYKKRFTECLFENYYKDEKIKNLTDSLEELQAAMALAKQKSSFKHKFQFRRRSDKNE